MNEKDPAVFASHILECIDKIEEYTEEISKDEFKSSTQLQDAVIRRVEINRRSSKKYSRRNPV